MRQKTSPRGGCTPAAGENDSAMGILAHAYPYCPLHGRRIVDVLPDAPCPLRDPHPSHALFTLKDRAFRNLGVIGDLAARAGRHQLRVYDLCAACVDRVLSCAHHREHVARLRDANGDRGSTATVVQTRATAILLPIRDAATSPCHRNGKPVVEVASHLTRRRGRPTHA